MLPYRDGSVAISVRDRGLGIPRHEHNEIFKKFVRGTASLDHGIKGTGIGLAMVRHIVAAHGGTVRVESAPGEGSTFAIVLPVQAAGSGLQARGRTAGGLKPAQSPKPKA